jgi:hypothetical protein
MLMFLPRKFKTSSLMVIILDPVLLTGSIKAPQQHNVLDLKEVFLPSIL